MNDIALAVAKEALLTGAGALTGRGGGFFGNLLKVIGLGVQVASLASPAGTGFQIAGVIGGGIAGGQRGAAAGAATNGVGFLMPSGKPVVIINNPIILSSDIERISSSAVEAANKRVA